MLPAEGLPQEGKKNMSAKQSDSVGIEMTESEYLAFERTSEIRHEYVNGHAYAMTGASVNHNRMTNNLSREFGVHLKGKTCEPFTSDMRLKLHNEYRYPDVMVVCDGEFYDEGYSTKNPVIIVEVLSKSTRRTDETSKRFAYMNIPSLQEYVLIEQEFVDVEVCRRSEGWISKHYYLGDKVPFESIDLLLSVEEIYERVDNEDMREWKA